MRFYFQEAGAKVATKCIRVASSATAKAVIETLIEKFRPDMRMLSIPQYALYEIHENGEERRLEDSERPLLVQLNWHSDDREGRFLLRRIDEKVRRVRVVAWFHFGQHSIEFWCHNNLFLSFFLYRRTKCRKFHSVSCPSKENWVSGRRSSWRSYKRRLKVKLLV